MLPDAFDTVISRQAQFVAEQRSTHGSMLHAPFAASTFGSGDTSGAPIPAMLSVRVCVVGPAANAVPATSKIAA
jgi:hypothetical protein